MKKLNVGNKNNKKEQHQKQQRFESDHHHHHQFLFSVSKIGPEIVLLQDTLFAAASPASTQDFGIHQN
jgi:hypothetical protein